MAGLGDIAANFSGGFSAATSLAQYIFYGVVFGVVLYFAYYIMSFNVEARILERNGGKTPMERMEKGRFKKDKNNPGVVLFSMLKDKRWEMPLPPDYIMLKKASFGRVRKVIYFMEDEHGRIQPFRPPHTGNAEQWSGFKPNAIQFMTAKLREYAMRFQKGDFWQKYGNLIQMAGMVLMFVMILILFRQLDKVNEGLASVAAAFENAAKNLAAANSGGQIIVNG